MKNNIDKEFDNMSMDDQVKMFLILDIMLDMEEAIEELIVLTNGHLNEALGVFGFSYTGKLYSIAQSIKNGTNRKIDSIMYKRRKLEAKLYKAIVEENYEEAALIRNEIARLSGK